MKRTPKQYYFPYFFDEYKLREELIKYDLTTETEFDKKINQAVTTHIKTKNKTLLSIKTHDRIMCYKNKLIRWFSQKNKLHIFSYSLSSPFSKNIWEIYMDKLNIGQNTIENNLSLKKFVTFIRSSKINYSTDYHETFGILIINNNEVELIPFDWFNKTGGDYGYVWPAIAQLDINSNCIYGSGMRMKDFKVQL